MAATKAAARKSADKSSPKPASSTTNKTDIKSNPQSASQAKKRKSPSSTNSPQSSSKAARRSARSTSTSHPPPPPPPPPPVAKTLNYLLSPSILPYVRPKDELSLPPNTFIRHTYTTTIPLTPFEELLSAVVLSRPISHTLGQRSIRTLLNPPYSLNTAHAIQEAGAEKVHEALEEARTQHKAKTAEGVFGLAGLVLEKFAGDEEGEGTELKGLRERAGGSAKNVRDVLTREVKGMGKTGAEIFLRRIQGVWPECYPIVDERSKGALVGLGLPGDAEGLRELMEKEWERLNVKGVEGKGAEEKKRMAFVVVVERAVGAELEGNVGDLIEAINNNNNNNNNNSNNNSGDEQAKKEEE